MGDQANEDITDLYDENAAIEEEDDEDVEPNTNRANEFRERRNNQNNNIYKIFPLKRRLIHFCFKEVIMLSFIPSLIYNVFWIVTLKRKEFGNLINFGLDEIRENIIKACFLVLTIGIFILFFPRIICGKENPMDDFSFLRVIGKYGITFFFSRKTTNNIVGKFFSNNMLSSSNKIYFWINLYYILENVYIIAIESIIAIILLAMLIRAVKEILSAFGYIL